MVAWVLAPTGLWGAAYIKFDGVDGEVTVAEHRTWSDLVSVSQAIRRTPPAVGGSRTGALIFDDLTGVKALDKASPKLAEAVCLGKVFPKVEIHLTTRLAGQDPVYLAYELKNVMITSYQLNGSASDARPMEQLSLNFEEIKVTYTEYDAAGRKKGNVEYTWKVEKGEN